MRKKNKDTLAEVIEQAAPVKKRPGETDFELFARGLAGYPALVCALPDNLGGGGIVYAPTGTRAEIILSFDKRADGEPIGLLYAKAGRAKRYRRAYEKKFGSMANESMQGWNAEKVLQMVLSFYKAEAAGVLV